MSSAVQPPVPYAPGRSGVVLSCWNLLGTFSVRLARTPSATRYVNQWPLRSSKYRTYFPPGDIVVVLLPQCSSTFFGLPLFRSSRNTSL